jgi:prepilin signal peptidase PulO-like enzyme (type II secretory pathway)
MGGMVDSLPRRRRPRPKSYRNRARVQPDFVPGHRPELYVIIKRMRRIPALFAALVVLSFALPALAQPAPPLPVSTLSPPLVAIALLGLLAGYVAQGAETGSVLGLFKIPPAAIPYLSTVGTFLASLVTLLVTAAQSSALTGAAVFNAIVLSLYMLVAPATGSALRHHIDTPKLRAAAKAAAKTAAVLACLALASTVTVACGGGFWQTVLTTVETDVNSGQALAFLEGIVQQFFPGLDQAGIDSILQGILSILQTSGNLNASGQANAATLQTQIRVKLDAAHKAGWQPTPDAARLAADLDASRRTGAPLPPALARLARSVERSPALAQSY